MKPLAVDLCCGLGGWTEGLLAVGWDVVGFDIENHVYGPDRYPAQLVIQDIRTLTGTQFKGKVDLIVASPPCQKYSYMAMPWKRAKDLAKWYREDPARIIDLNELFDACVRIAAEAEVPIVIENVRGAQPWVGRSRWSYGSYHLWGDIPALMPMVRHVAKRPGHDWNRFKDSGEVSPHWRLNGEDSLAVNPSIKNAGGSWFNVAHNTTSGHGQNPDGRLERDELKTVGHLNKRNGHRSTSHLTNPAEHIKCGGDDFLSGEMSASHSKSTKRKAASAMIAKIPLALSRHIAQVFYPKN